MANANGKCVICGVQPTVKAHLFPRALMLDMKGASPQLVAGNRNRDGILLRQNGEWDEDLICSEHEELLGQGDDYGVDFCRRWRQVAAPHLGEKALSVPNPEPDKLLQFAYGIVWRHVHSRSGREIGLDLGPYSSQIICEMSKRGRYSLQLLIGRNPLTVQGKRIDVGIAPYKQRMGDLLIWQFTISGLDFYLKTDQRPFPKSWNDFLANDNDPIIIGQIEERGVHETPKLFPVIKRMKKTTWKAN